jgi:DNA-dependent RNA polymerase auxiliary subunit epsilon
MKESSMQGTAKGRKQRGMTLMGFIIGLIVFCFFAYMGMVLGPAYNEFYGVRKAMNTVAAGQQRNSTDALTIRRALDRQFNVGYVESISGKQVLLVREKTGNLISVEYEVRKAFVYNIDFVIKFKHSVELGDKSSGD